MKIHFGVFAPPLHEQLGCDPEHMEHFQSYADAVRLLYLAEMITDTEKVKILKRLIKGMEREARKRKRWNVPAEVTE